LEAICRSVAIVGCSAKVVFHAKGPIRTIEVGRHRVLAIRKFLGNLEKEN
jgi:hypothetical protein